MQRTKNMFRYAKLTQSTKKPFRSVNFGVKIDKDGSSVYTYLNGMERKSVYYSRREDKAKGITKDTQEVAWKDRYTFDRIAQLAFIKTLDGEFVEVDELGKTERGADGFGSTGK